MSEDHYLVRLGVCMVVSLAVNAVIGEYLELALSAPKFIVSLDVTYGSDADMELFYDTGKDFNLGQRVHHHLKKGHNSRDFSFELKNGEQLRNLRLDFGSNTRLRRLELHSVRLSSEGKILFELDGNEISKKIGLLTGVSKVDPNTTTLTLNTDHRPLDPYLVLDAINELIYPNWQRVLTLTFPWFALFLLPMLRWLKSKIYHREYVLVLVGLFFTAIPLKIAWVTFTALLLLAYALFNFYRDRGLRFNPVFGVMIVFFLVPLLFLGSGEISELGIPLGFVIFAIVGSLIDFSNKTDRIKSIYANVFLMVMSITVTSWMLLVLYFGYYYKIDLLGYFAQIKMHAHATTFWLYYPHTTFLSFFIIVGALLASTYIKDKR